MRLARSAVALLGSVVAVGACSKSAQVETRAVTLHAAASCAPGAAAFGLYFPFGDFQPPSSQPSLPLANVGGELAGMPDDTREVVVDVTDQSDVQQWRAHTLVPATGDVDLLLLAYQSPCALTDTIDARTNAAVGAVDATHVLVAGGMETGSVPTTALADLARGSVRLLSAGLLVPRAQATVTAWSGGAVVAGGIRADATAAPQDTAEVYVSSAGDFDGQLIALSEARARHGAVALVSGETLLVGGVGGDGGVLGSMEIVDAQTHRAQTTRLASLSVPRADPLVIRLASGEILVAGGVDATGTPVSLLEWFKSDASAPSHTPQTLVASTHEAFIPLNAGGALAVIVPDTPSPGFQNVWVISAAGGLEAATPIDVLSDARLFDGSDQAPVLWTGDRWLIWQPWVGAFTDLAPAIGADGPTGDPIASPEPGLGVWLSGTTVRALRFGARGPYVSATAPLLASDTSGTAPDRLADTGPSSAITFDATAGLSLASGASVFVTDATFASFMLDAETPGGSPPAVVLRDASGNETLIDPTTCPLAPGATLHVERDGDTMRASSGGALVTCSAAPASGARVAVGVRGEGANASVVRAVVITRE